MNVSNKCFYLSMREASVEASRTFLGLGWFGDVVAGRPGTSDSKAFEPEENKIRCY